MPTYHGASVKATLRVGPLSGSPFDSGLEPLAEVQVPDQPSILFLGPSRNIPFQMVEAGVPRTKHQLLTPGKPLRSSGRQKSYTPFGFNNYLLEPKSLSLQVDIGTASFNRSAPDKRSKNEDLKIEVFVNGQLHGCDMKLARRRLEAASQKAIFSGYRNSKNTEFSWILQPPDSRNYSDALKDPAIRNYARERWYDIGACLIQEADARLSEAKGQASPPSAQSLLHLGQLKMPPAITDMYPTETRLQFSIIDVVVTMGAAHRYLAGFLITPTRLDHVQPGSQTLSNDRPGSLTKRSCTPRSATASVTKRKSDVASPYPRKKPGSVDTQIYQDPDTSPVSMVGASSASAQQVSPAQQAASNQHGRGGALTEGQYSNLMRNPGQQAQQPDEQAQIDMVMQVFDEHAAAQEIRVQKWTANTYELRSSNRDASASPPMPPMPPMPPGKTISSSQSQLAQLLKKRQRAKLAAADAQTNMTDEIAKLCQLAAEAASPSPDRTVSQPSTPHKGEILKEETPLGRALELATNATVTFGPAALIQAEDNNQGRRRSSRLSERTQEDVAGMRRTLSRSTPTAKPGCFEESQVLYAARFIVSVGAGYGYDDGEA